LYEGDRHFREGVIVPDRGHCPQGTRSPRGTRLEPTVLTRVSTHGMYDHALPGTTPRPSNSFLAHRSEIATDFLASIEISAERWTFTRSFALLTTTVTTPQVLNERYHWNFRRGAYQQLAIMETAYMGTGTEVDKVSNTNFMDGKMTMTETLSLKTRILLGRECSPFIFDRRHGHC
jgi:hypothetical protein